MPMRLSTRISPMIQARLTSAEHMYMAISVERIINTSKTIGDTDPRRDTQGGPQNGRAEKQRQGRISDPSFFLAETLCINLPGLFARWNRGRPLSFYVGQRDAPLLGAPGSPFLVVGGQQW
jgi:hypothetical protein